MKKASKTKEIYKVLNTAIDLHKFIKQEKRHHEDLLEETELLTKKLRVMKEKYEHYFELYSGLSDLKGLTPCQV